MHDTVGLAVRPPLATGPRDRARWAALVVLCAGMLMIVLDATVVNVALPAIKSDLGFSQSGLAWVVNAYLIAFGGLLLAGRLGDLVSRRGVFLAGLAIAVALIVLRSDPRPTARPAADDLDLEAVPEPELALR